MAVLTVGPGQQFARLSDAINASHDGDQIAVQAGTYTNDFATITDKISIVGVGGMAHLQATEPPPDGKAILVTQDDVTLENIEFSGVRVDAGNGAGIRYEGGDLVVRNSFFHDNEMHILGANIGAARGSVQILNSEFGATHDSGLFNHGVYLGVMSGPVTIRDSYFHDIVDGSHIKSRAAETTIVDNWIVDGNGAADYNIDLPNGGQEVVRDNVIVQGAGGHNEALLHFGGEAEAPVNSSLLVEGNLFESFAPEGVIVFNETPFAATIQNNQSFNMAAVAHGPFNEAGNTSLTVPLDLDANRPWDTQPPMPSMIDGTGNPDALMGTAGADTLDGEAGDDRLFGGGGADVFLFTGAFGHDIVHDAEPAERLVFAGYAGQVADVTSADGDTMIAIGGNSVTLLGVAQIGAPVVSGNDLVFTVA